MSEIRSDAPSLRESPKWVAEPKHKVGRAIFIDERLIQTPADGWCIHDSWWTIRPTKGVAFYYQPVGYGRSEEPSPQCNQSEATARALGARGWPDCEIRQLPVVFMAHAARAMASDRKAFVAARKDGSSPKIPPQDPTHGR